jgi:signal transduction histidine kinase
MRNPAMFYFYLQDYKTFDNREARGTRIASVTLVILIAPCISSLRKETKEQLMASFPAPTISGRHHGRVSANKGVEKKISRQHQKIASFSFAERSLPRLDPIVRSLAAELGRVREKERQKIADDLHDHAGQNLALAKMKLDLLKSLLGGEHEALVQEIADLIQDTIKDTRSLIHELHPEWLCEAGLEDALRWFAEQTEARYGLHCITEVASVPKPLHKDLQEILFHAVRELLVNVAKHAEASTVKISGGYEKDRLVVRVVDNGRGFVPSTVSAPGPGTGGFGLMIIRARIGLLGGNLYIDSRAGAGTSIMIALPLEIHRK